MKVEVKKSLLNTAVDKMSDVALKGTKAEFDLAARITFTAEDGKVFITATNGHLDARYNIVGNDPDDVQVKSTGKVTVDAKVCKRVVKALGKEDSFILLEEKSNAFHLKDMSAKKKRAAKLESLSSAADINIRKISGGFSTELDSELVRKSVTTVGKYKSTRTYKVRYLMLCLHFLKDCTRFVCGDGMRFGILQHPVANASIDSDDGQKFLWPVEQADIIAKLIGGTDKVTISFSKDKKKCYLLSGNSEILLKGIPDEDYIEYETHAFRANEAIAIVDIDMKDITSMLEVVDAVRDDELIKEGDFHSSRFRAAKDFFELEVDEQRYQCVTEADDPRYYDIEDTPKFNSIYSANFLKDAASFPNRELVRFHCIQEDGIMIAEPMNVDSDTNASYPPRKDDGDGSRLIFFFASASTDEEN